MVTQAIGVPGRCRVPDGLPAATWWRRLWSTCILAARAQGSERHAFNLFRFMSWPPVRKIFPICSLPVSGFYLLAAPTTPEGTRTDILNRATAGERLSFAEIKETIDQARGKASTPIESLRCLSNPVQSLGTWAG
jgi:hypothetical protein